jgi:ABC-type Fe3+-siderophore transport system permease subunit
MLLAASDTVHVVTQSGIGLGAAIAVVCSWQRNKSIVLAFIAGLLSWIYVIYFAITRKPDEIKS